MVIHAQEIILCHHGISTTLQTNDTTLARYFTTHTKTKRANIMQLSAPSRLTTVCLVSKAGSAWRIVPCRQQMMHEQHYTKSASECSSFAPRYKSHYTRKLYSESNSRRAICSAHARVCEGDSSAACKDGVVYRCCDICTYASASQRKVAFEIALQTRSCYMVHFVSRSCRVALATSTVDASERRRHSVRRGVE